MPKSVRRPDSSSLIWSESRTAEEIGKSERTLILWRQQGLGPPFVRIGKTVCYQPSSVARWLEKQEQIPFRTETAPIGSRRESSTMR